jgi:hypothetical protein
MAAGNRTCNCGAVYHRTESLAATREINSFECAICGATMESWNTAWVPYLPPSRCTFERAGPKLSLTTLAISKAAPLASSWR